MTLSTAVVDSPHGYFEWVPEYHSYIYTPISELAYAPFETPLPYIQTEQPWI
jgi:hypothetical protein